MIGIGLVIAAGNQLPLILDGLFRVTEGPYGMMEIETLEDIYYRGEYVDHWIERVGGARADVNVGMLPKGRKLWTSHTFVMVMRPASQEIIAEFVED